MVLKEQEIRDAINRKGFNDGVVQLLHVGNGYKYECGDVLWVGINNSDSSLVVLVADPDDNHFFFYLSDIEENAYITFNRLVNEILN